MVSVDTLKKLDLFVGLMDLELEAISEISEIAEYPRGTVIFKEGDEAASLYVLIEGNVALNFEVGRNREVIVHSVGYGQAFGWSALVQPYLFTASARCTNNSRVLTIDRKRLRKLFELDCHMGFVIMEKLAGLVSNRLRIHGCS